MSHVLPQIKVTANVPDASSKSPQSDVSSAVEGGAAARLLDGNDGAARPVSRASKLLPTFTMNQPASSAKPGANDPRRESQAIDPLSHQILKRTNTQGGAPSKSRPSLQQEVDFPVPEAGASIASGRTSTEPIGARGDAANFGAKDKRNRVSFFSRFAPKRKDLAPDASEDASETGDARTEGMDADVFSQPIGYVPQFPSPPKYIKVRSHGKKDKDFGRLFLAQELRGRTGLEIAQSGGRPLKTATSRPGEQRKDGNAIWAMEFSKDGKHLAAGGKDFVVRIWAVLSTKEDRHAHELDEESAGKDGQNIRLNAPVFVTKSVQEYSGHTASVLDLSWSKNNFLLSSSMDKTVRLWHVSREECLCCFKHSDFVTSIQFHPRDDRFFLAGSLDSKLRLWSIPDKSVAYWSSLPEFITAVAFTPDGKTAIAGCLNGICLFFETEGLKYQSQIHVRSAHGRNAKGSKVTGIQAITCPPEDPNGEVKLLITSNDSRARVYNLRDKTLELKLKGNENSCSQIRATFSDDYRYIICGSENSRVYIWPTRQAEAEKEKRPVEMFEAHSMMVTTAIMAPIKTRKLLSASTDPLYDLCNPPPVTLISRTQSEQSSILPTDEGTHRPSLPPTPAASEFAKASKPEESPAYQARCAHPDGNIIITADFNGQIKVFRQDCAYHNRLRNNDSALSKKMLGRTNSVATKHSNRSHRESFQINNHSSDRILSWRQSINSTTGSFDSFRNPPLPSNGTSLTHKRSISPKKSLGQLSLQSNSFRNNSHTGTARSTNPNQSAAHPPPPQFNDTPNPSPLHRSPSASEIENPPHPPTRSTSHLTNNDPPSSFATSSDPTITTPSASSAINHDLSQTPDPLMLHGEQSYMFWNRSQYEAQAAAAHAVLDHNNHSHHNPGASGANGSGNTSTAASSTVSLTAAADDGTPLASNGKRLGVPIAREMTNVSRLSSEDDGSTDDGASGGGGGGGGGGKKGGRTAQARAGSVDDEEDDGEDEGDVNCKRCGGDSFRMRTSGGAGAGAGAGGGRKKSASRVLECIKCGLAV